MKIKGSGRKKGTPNVLTANIKDQIDLILKVNFSTEKIEQDLKLLEPKDRISLYLKLLEYCIPKQKAIEVKDSNYQTFIVKPPVFDLTPEDIRKISAALEAEC